MLIIRKAMSSDRDDISRILRELELEYPSSTLKDFWVADLDNKVIAVARVEEFEDFCFLNSVGTTTDQQGKGIAGKLLEGILGAYSKDVYLYTIIPNFFRKYGFEISDFCVGLPERKTFDCGNCQPGKCVCMLHRTRSVVQEPERKSFKS